MGKVIFERILYENVFYGLLFGGYLGWISILHSFSQPQMFDYAFVSIITIAWIGYGYLYLRSENKQIYLNDFKENTGKFKSKKYRPEDLKISIQFG